MNIILRGTKKMIKLREVKKRRIIPRGTKRELI